MPQNMKFCSDPLKKHKKIIFKSVRKVKEDIILRSLGLLKDDDLLCVNCLKLISKEPGLLKQTAVEAISPMEISEDSCASSDSSLSNPQLMTPSKHLDSFPKKDILHDNILPYLDESPIKTTTKPGESFNAELVKMDVNAKLKSGGRPPEDKIYHLIVKFLSQDPFNREMIRKVGYHIREFHMYSEVIHKMNQFQAAQTNNAFPIHIPEFIYGKCTRKEYVLVIENMKEGGYETNPKEKGLTIEQAKLAMEHIARVHGVSYAYNKQHNFLSEFPCYDFSHTISRLFKAVVYASIDNVLPFLRTQENCEEIVERLESGKAKLPEKFEAMWDDQSRHALLCLTHGDFWCNNLLFLSSEGVLTDLSMIDWQISQWNSPVMDLHYLLATSTTATLRANHLPALLHHYHSTFTAVTTALAVQPLNWSLEEFRVEFDRLSLVGLLMGVCLIQGTLSKAGEKINQQNSPTDSSCGGTCLKNHLKAVVAKVAIPMAFHPSGSLLMRLSVKSLLKPIGRELLEEENPTMNQRLLELMKEGHQNGLFDVLNL